MCLRQKIINFLLLVSGIQNSMQTNYFPIIEGLNITNPYYVMETFEFRSKNVLKHHFKKSEFAMICKSSRDIPIKHRKNIQSIVQLTKNLKDSILDSWLDFHFPTLILLITNSSQKANLR